MISWVRTFCTNKINISSISVAMRERDASDRKRLISQRFAEFKVLPLKCLFGNSVFVFKFNIRSTFGMQCIVLSSSYIVRSSLNSEPFHLIFGLLDTIQFFIYFDLFHIVSRFPSSLYCLGLSKPSREISTGIK